MPVSPNRVRNTRLNVSAAQRGAGWAVMTASPIMMAVAAAIKPATAAKNTASCRLCETSAGSAQARTEGCGSPNATCNASVADVAGGMVTRKAWRPSDRACSTSTSASELAILSTAGRARDGNIRNPSFGGWPARMMRLTGRSESFVAVIMYQTGAPASCEVGPRVGDSALLSSRMPLSLAKLTARDAVTGAAAATDTSVRSAKTSVRCLGTTAPKSCTAASQCG